MERERERKRIVVYIEMEDARVVETRGSEGVCTERATACICIVHAVG